MFSRWQIRDCMISAGSGPRDVLRNYCLDPSAPRISYFINLKRGSAVSVYGRFVLWIDRFSLPGLPPVNLGTSEALVIPDVFSRLRACEYGTSSRRPGNVLPPPAVQSVLLSTVNSVQGVQLTVNDHLLLTKFLLLILFLRQRPHVFAIVWCAQVLALAHLTANAHGKSAFE